MPRRSSMTSMVAASREPTTTRPASGVTRALKLRRRVVFPDPLSPTREMHSPSAISRLTPSRAVVSPKCLTSASAESAGVGQGSERVLSQSGRTTQASKSWPLHVVFAFSITFF